MEANLDTLPEELKSHIVSFLVDEPPSSTWYRREPCVSTTEPSPSRKPLKNLSLVSKGWRRLVKCPLFRCIRIKLEFGEDLGLPALMSPPISNFRNAIEAQRYSFKSKLFQGVGYPREIEWAYRHCWQDSAPERAARWLTMLDFKLSSLLALLANDDIAMNVDTLCLTVDSELDDGMPDYVREEIHCLIASATFWDILFRSLEPSQVTIVAPPSTLACLLNCSIRMLDSWAFPGMKHQLVTLQRSRSRSDAGRLLTTSATSTRTGYDRSENVHLRMGPNDPARPALASLLYIRPWTHLVVNEGSYLQAYATYEYFHKEPPGIMYPLAQGFEVPMALESFTYHAMFPFHDYLAAAVNLMSTGIIRQLHVQLAPRSDDKTWSDPARAGKVDIADCWSEIEQVYSLMFAGATPEDGHLAAHSNVALFSSGDVGIDSLKELLDRSFGALGWEENEVGVWTITEEAAARRRIAQGLDEE